MSDKQANHSIEEARRQIIVCNACRYCEGFCSVFPALQKQRVFADGDITQLANLCHNCRACHYSCQYSDPHEFRINIPAAMTDVRVESWERFSYPSAVARAFMRYGTCLVIALVAALSLLMVLINRQPATPVDSFYSYLSHNAMVSLFLPAFVLPIVITFFALRAYWQEVDGKTVEWTHISSAIKNVLHLKNLSGGQGQGCNYEKSDKYSNARRYSHQATVSGFLLCFASTSCATIMHYVFDHPAPYDWYELPKLLGVPGGVLLSLGCAHLAWLKTKADKSLGQASVWGAEMASVLLLGFTGVSGLALYALGNSGIVDVALTVHLSSVLVLFILLPYTKLVHGFFRVAALIRNAQS